MASSRPSLMRRTIARWAAEAARLAHTETPSPRRRARRRCTERTPRCPAPDTGPRRIRCTTCYRLRTTCYRVDTRRRQRRRTSRRSQPRMSLAHTARRTTPRRARPRMSQARRGRTPQQTSRPWRRRTAPACTRRRTVYSRQLHWRRYPAYTRCTPQGSPEHTFRGRTGRTPGARRAPAGTESRCTDRWSPHRSAET